VLVAALQRGQLEPDGVRVAQAFRVALRMALSGGGRVQGGHDGGTPIGTGLANTFAPAH
jgi:hypothetical protein